MTQQDLKILLVRAVYVKRLKALAHSFLIRQNKYKLCKRGATSTNNFEKLSFQTIENILSTFYKNRSSD